MVRQFFIENALHWVHEYRIDGLRLDATHAIRDRGPRQLVTELAARVHESAVRPVYVIAEDCRNLAHMVRPEGEGGWGLDGVWADDFHHKVRVAFAGDRDGYYSDYSGSTANLARTLNQGWHYTGQFSRHLQENRGTDPTGIPPRRFVFCIQNHDQVGNRAMGERLQHQIDLAAYRAATALLLCAPATPLLFMGQEWGATSPFQYFTDHPPELGRLVTEGRRSEFRHFAAFSDVAMRERIPDPQAESTFAASRLDWRELDREPHASLVRLYQQLLRLRQDPAIRWGRFTAYALGETALLLRHDGESGPSLIAVIQLRGRAQVDLDPCNELDGLDLTHAQLVLTTEDPPFAPDPQPPKITRDAARFRIAFARCSAVLLHVSPVRAA
jgi:maltooligosyltrehalose trehalohydrolase